MARATTSSLSRVSAAALAAAAASALARAQAKAHALNNRSSRRCPTRGAHRRRLDIHAKTTGNASHVITWLQQPIGVLALACMARNQPDMIRLLLARGADPFALSKGIGDVAMWACIGFQGLDSDPIETEYNLDVLYAHNPKTLDTVMPLVACDGPMMMAAFSIPALRHWQHAYPERFAADLRRIDGVGTSILGHHMVYVSDVDFIQTMLDMGGVGRALSLSPSKPHRPGHTSGVRQGGERDNGALGAIGVRLATSHPGPGS